MSRRCAILFLIPLVFSCTWSRDAGRILSDGEPGLRAPKQGFRILVWNLYKNRETPEFAEDWKEISKAVGKDRPLLCLFQEIEAEPALESWARDQSLSGRFVTQLTPGAGPSGIATLGTWAADEMVPLVTETKEPFTDTPKTALISIFPLADRTERLTVCNIHGINFVADSLWKAELAAIVTRLEDRTGPLIFAGDFNPWNRTRFTFLEAEMTRLGLSSAVDDPRVERTGPYPLDRIYYSADTLTLVDSGVVSPVASSDHRPLWAEFRLRSPSP